MLRGGIPREGSLPWAGERAELGTSVPNTWRELLKEGSCACWTRRGRAVPPTPRRWGAPFSHAPPCGHTMLCPLGGPLAPPSWPVTGPGHCPPPELPPACDGASRLPSSGVPRPCRQPLLVLQMVQSLGFAIYRALDWGLDESEERELSPQLERLIDLMANSDCEDSGCGAADEGYGGPEEEEEAAEGGPRALRTFSQAMRLCAARLTDPRGAQAHYQAVCRALFVETLELQAFLARVREAKEVSEPRAWGQALNVGRTPASGQVPGQWAVAGGHLATGVGRLQLLSAGAGASHLWARFLERGTEAQGGSSWLPAFAHGLLLPP